jgi:hypothetical protein
MQKIACGMLLISVEKDKLEAHIPVGLTQEIEQNK